jgi:hypothetical protein
LNPPGNAQSPSNGSLLASTTGSASPSSSWAHGHLATGRSPYQPRAATVPLATFNLGLEAAQLLGLIAIAIPVWAISRSAAATTAVAAAFASVALLWVAQRAFDPTTPLEPLVATALASPERMALLAGVVAAAAAAGRSRKRPDVATSLSPIRR